MNTKSDKTKAFLCPFGLKTTQDSVKLDAVSMAILLDIPYETYRNYLYGRRPVPADVSDKVVALWQREKDLITRIIKNTECRVDEEFPNGIPSELDDFS